MQDPQAQNGHLLLLGSVGGDLAAFAVVDDGVGSVGGLDEVEPFGDLPLQVAAPQDVLADDRWDDILTAEDRRGLTPLFWQHVLPYGEVKLDTSTRLSIST